MNPKIEITGTPPTQEQLAKWREEAHQAAARADWGWASAIFVVLVLAAMDLIAASDVVVVVVAWAVAWTVAWAVAWTVAVAVAVVWTVVVAVVEAGVEAGVGAMVVAGVGVGAGAVAFAYYKWVETPRTHSKETLEALTELSPEQHATECTAYVGWFEEDETVQQYQRQVAAQERNPIMAEYRAVKSWVNTAEGRKAQAEKIEKARIACERLRTADL